MNFKCSRKQRNLLCHFLRPRQAGKYKVKALAESVSGEDQFPGSQMAPFALSSSDRKGKWALWDLFYKGTNPIHGDSITLEVRISAHEFGVEGHKHSDHHKGFSRQILGMVVERELLFNYYCFLECFQLSSPTISAQRSRNVSRVQIYKIPQKE
jgi:hypothetical protein